MPHNNKRKRNYNTGFKSVKSDPATNDRASQACRLRMNGLSYKQIAEALGYASPSGAHEAVTRTLAATLQEAGDGLRTMEVSRLDMLLTKYIPMAMAVVAPGDHRAAASCIKAGHLVHKYLQARYELTGLQATQFMEHKIVKEYDVTNDPDAL